MLPLNLLRARTRKGQIKPVYANLNEDNLAFAKELIKLFQSQIGARKGDMLEKVSAYEMGGWDYRFVRGLSLILQRRCTFHAETPVEPALIRKPIFEEASRRNVTESTEREQVLKEVADQLDLTIAQAKDYFYADLEEELIVAGFNPISETELLKRYNLALTQTLLFRSTFLEVKVSDGWKEILREIKFRGLMYQAESNDGDFKITVDGPLSLFKLTQRYGTSIAKILPAIIKSGEWKISSSILRTGQFGKRIYQLVLTSVEVADKIMPDAFKTDRKQVSFDSYVEEKFYEDFMALDSEWQLTREPSPLIAGRHVFIPDFCFEKGGAKLYLEIVGFWTRRYLETKIKKLQQLRGVDIVIAADQKLACDKLRQVQDNMLFFKGTVPALTVLRLLEKREAIHFESEVQHLDLQHLRLEDNIVNLERIAEEYGVSEKALRKKLENVHLEGYTLAGGLFIKDRKLQELELKLASLTEPSLSKAIRIIENDGVEKPYDILSKLNYGINWHGLDLEKSSIYKRNSK